MGNKCCTNCFSEIEIINFIDSEKIIGDCDYCNSNNVNFCDVVDVGNFIMEGIERHYEDAANQVGYASSEGGYLLPTKDIADILLEDENIFGEILFKSSVMKDGINLVLFRGPDISTTDNTTFKDAWLIYKEKKTHQVIEIMVNTEIL